MITWNVCQLTHVWEGGGISSTRLSGLFACGLKAPVLFKQSPQGRYIFLFSECDVLMYFFLILFRCIAFILIALYFTLVCIKYSKM
uniref:Uncharacterized protein n=1 Tax=Anguilla anguilla TaxID=7936 RepID=A0A0E9RFU8_ANGAN